MQPQGQISSAQFIKTLLNRLNIQGDDAATTETLALVDESLIALQTRLDEANSQLIHLSTQVDVGAVLKGTINFY
jgi:hypothetical protein